MNTNELVLDRVRELIFTDISTDEVLARLTSLKEPTLTVSANGEDLTDAFDAIVDTIYTAKTAEFTASNAFFSLNLAALQFGAEKEVATDTDTISTPITEILTVADKIVTLSHTPNKEIKYIYKLENKALVDKYTLASTASDTEFAANGAEITVPTSVEDGEKIYVEYEYDSTTAARVINNTENFPELVGCKVFCIFKDPCNTNVKYAGIIIASRAKLDPTSIEMALTSPGEHSFTVKFNKNYCEESADLFEIVIAEE